MFAGKTSLSVCPSANIVIWKSWRVIFISTFLANLLDIYISMKFELETKQDERYMAPW